MGEQEKNETVKLTADWVRGQLLTESTGHDWYHIERVTEMAKGIAAEEAAAPRPGATVPRPWPRAVGPARTGRTPQSASRSAPHRGASPGGPRPARPGSPRPSRLHLRARPRRPCIHRPRPLRPRVLREHGEVQGPFAGKVPVHRARVRAARSAMTSIFASRKPRSTNSARAAASTFARFCSLHLRPGQPCPPHAPTLSCPTPHDKNIWR